MCCATYVKSKLENKKSRPANKADPYGPMPRGMQAAMETNPLRDGNEKWERKGTKYDKHTHAQRPFMSS